MTRSLMLPLQHPTIQSQDEDSLQSRIFQIHSQKGDFRKVNEASLIQEIQSHNTQDEDTKMVDVAEEAAEAQSREGTMIKAREEMIQYLRRAQNDTLVSLDFVSLLLSKHAPTTAESTMSPDLKKTVPAGTLEARIVETAPPTAAESKSTELVSRSNKLQAFSKAADTLLQAAARLEDEAAKEKQYWEQILLIKEKGWSVSKVPRDPQTLGVHFGFQNAGPTWRNRGFAALRRNADGSLQLDQGATPSKPVAVQVSILQDGKDRGTFCLSPSGNANDDAIDAQILRARNTLFEQELFHEISREARLLANQGATMSSGWIEMPLGEKSLRLSLINLSNESPTTTSQPDRQLAECIAIALHLLLSHAHDQNLQRRSQPPPPMTLEPQPFPEYLLIRPIITHLQHRSNLVALIKLVQHLTRPLTTAKFPCSLEIPSCLHLGDPTSLLQSPSTLSPKSTTHHPNRLLTSLIATQTTTITLHLPSSASFLSTPQQYEEEQQQPARRHSYASNNPLKLTLHTYISAPSSGTEYSFSPTTITYPPPVQHLTSTLPRLTNLDDVKSALRHLLTVDVVATIALSCAPSSPTGETKDAKRGKGREGWTVVNAHAGSLVQGSDRVQVRLFDDRLGLRYTQHGGVVGEEGERGRGRGRATYLWNGEGGVYVVGQDRGGPSSSSVAGESEVKEENDRKRQEGEEGFRGLLDIIQGRGK